MEIVRRAADAASLGVGLLPVDYAALLTLNQYLKTPGSLIFAALEIAALNRFKKSFVQMQYAFIAMRRYGACFCADHSSVLLVHDYIRLSFRHSVTSHTIFFHMLERDQNHSSHSIVSHRYHIS